MLRKKDKQEAMMTWLLPALCLILGACLVFISAYRSRDKQNTLRPKRPTEETLFYAGAYIQQADAWLKGQAYLDIKPDPGLLAMKNPYDFQARQAAKVPYLFDRVLYDGKYYSYFGTAPLILIFLPGYLLTGTFPSLLDASTLFALASLPCLLLALRSLFRLFGLRVEPCSFLLYYLGLVTGSLIPYALLCSDTYFVPVQSAMFGLSLAAGASFAAFAQESASRKTPAFFALASFGLAVILQSRPHVLVFAAALLGPFYVWQLFRRDLTLRQKGLQVAAFLLPIGAALGLTFYYNRLRFGQITNFGQDYQLTLADTRTYSLKAAWLLPSFLSTFLTAPRLTGHFPFLAIDSFKEPLQGFLYRGPQLGLLYIPFSWLLFLGPLFGFRERDKIKKALLIASCAAGALVILWLSWYEFCMAGSLLRYNCDLSLPLALTAALAGLPLMKDRRARRVAAAIAAFCVVFATLLPRA